jgi:PAS domain S-box-containing protein
MSKILIIEPDKAFLEKIKSYFTELGYEIICTENGSTGVQKAIQYKPDLIISHTNPYELSGHEVLNIVRQVNSTSVIPFVFLTTKKSYGDLRDVMNLGVDDFLVKPFKLEDLKKLIEVRLDKQYKLMEKAERRFNLLIDYADAAICIYYEQKFDYVNHKFCEILGYAKSELIGMNMVNLVYKDDIPYVIDKVNRCFKNLQDEIEVVFRAIKKNREIVQLNFSAKVVEFERSKNLVGSITEIESNKIGIVRDIDQRNQLSLSTRERDVLYFICEGKTNQEISEKLNISIRTVEGHRYRLLKKSSCKNSIELVVYAIKHDLYRI